MDFELKHKQGARPAGPRVEAIARLSREFKAQAWPDCEDAGMNRCEYSRYVAGEYSYSEPWGNIKGEVLEAHRQRRERARQKAPIQDGYLSVWSEKESWRPEDAFRLVCGVKPLGASHRPINNLAKVPEAYEGLCGSVYIDAEAISKGCEISRVESKWNERLETPAKISPLEFIAWCEKRGIDTAWLSSIKSVPNTSAAPTPAPSASASDVAPPEPVADPAEAVPVSAGIVRHAIKARRDPLASVFARAMQEATDSACPYSVWAALVAMATGNAAPPELTDYREDKGLQATGARGGWLSKGAFLDRWRRGSVQPRQPALSRANTR